MTLRRPNEELLNALLARYGLHALRWRVVARLDCTVLRITSDCGTELALRIYALTRQALAPIEAKLAWLADLAVPRPRWPTVKAACCNAGTTGAMRCC